ncbi:hypothetical protein M413DRAFT_445154 [Hebeloma cylindrosporum]|uniref:Uncharacterized protein n=1 Tax=Hebeloma cylindrosporum TaxID=76867 RepID=A0A0C3CEA9_HEBCY|nr:hypothetical protein M413DRAFT_445154 [Hebeloma cylindrosporum h7]
MPIATTFGLLLMAAFPVLEGWSAELMLDEADDAAEAAELKAAETELCAVDADADAAEEAEDKAEVSVETMVDLVVLALTLVATWADADAARRERV